MVRILDIHRTHVLKVSKTGEIKWHMRALGMVKISFKLPSVTTRENICVLNSKTFCDRMSNLVTFLGVLDNAHARQML